jgi:hypothetical protein
VFQPHRGSAEVSTVKMTEEDFSTLEDNQVMVQARRLRPSPLCSKCLAYNLEY